MRALLSALLLVCLGGCASSGAIIWSGNALRQTEDFTCLRVQGVGSVCQGAATFPASEELAEMWSGLNRTAQLALLGAAVGGAPGAGAGALIGAALDTVGGLDGGGLGSASQLEELLEQLDEDPELEDRFLRFLQSQETE